MQLGNEPRKDRRYGAGQQGTAVQQVAAQEEGVSPPTHGIDTQAGTLHTQEGTGNATWDAGGLRDKQIVPNNNHNTNTNNNTNNNTNTTYNSQYTQAYTSTRRTMEEERDTMSVSCSILVR